MKAVACLVSLCVLAGLVSGEHFAWKVGQTYSYVARGRLMSGIAEINRQYSGMQLEYNIDLMVVGPNRLNFRPSQFKVVEMNDELEEDGWRDASRLTSSTPVDLSPEILKYLESPVEVEMSKGVITSIKVAGDLPTWAVNIKKAQVSEFVLDTTGETAVLSGNLNHQVNHVRPEEASTDSGFFYEVMEETVHGQCETYYTVSQSGPFPNQKIEQLRAAQQHKVQKQQQQGQKDSQEDSSEESKEQQQHQNKYKQINKLKNQKANNNADDSRMDSSSSEESQELHQKYSNYKQLVQKQSNEDQSEEEEHGVLAPELFHKFCENQHQLYEITKAVNFTACKDKPVLGYISPGLLINSRPGDNNAGNVINRMVYSRYVACGKDRRSYTILKIQQEEVYKFGVLPTEKIVGGAMKNVTLVDIKPTSRVPAPPTNPKVINDLTYTFDPKEQKMRNEGDNRVKTAFIYGQEDVNDNQESQERQQQSQEESEEIQQQQQQQQWQKQQQKKSRKNRPRRSVDSQESSEESNESQQQNDQVSYKTKAENRGVLDMPSLVNPPMLPLSASPLNKDGMKRRVELLLKEVVQDLMDKTPMAETETISKIAILAKILRLMKYSEVEELYHQLADKDQTDEDKIARNVFLDAVAIAGTNPCIKFLIDLVVKKNLIGEQAAGIIMTFSQYIRTPTQELLKYFWEQLIQVSQPSTGRTSELDQVRSTALLSFSNLLHDACINTRVMYSRYPIPLYGEFCNQNFVEREFLKPLVEETKFWVEQVVRESQHSATARHWTAVYMTALGNIGHPEVIPEVQKWLDNVDDIYVKVKAIFVLKRLIISRQAENIPVRVFSGVDRKNRDVLTDEIIEKNVLPILVAVAFDKTEDFEVRNAAISFLVRCTVVDVTLWQKLAYMTWFEKDQQVHAYVFTILRSLVRIDEPIDPVMWRAHLNAKAVFHLLKPMDSQTENFGKSAAFYNSEFYPEYQSGFMEHLSYFGSLDSWFPNAVHYHNYMNNGNGIGVAPTQFNIHSNSIRELFMHFLGKFERPSMSDISGNDAIRKIVDILSIAERTEEENPEADWHIKLRGEIERMFSLNKEIIDQLVESFKRSYITQLKVGIPINYQKTLQLGGIMIELPTILGVPVTVHSRLNSLVSLRGNLKVTNQNFLEDIELLVELHPIHSWKLISKIAFKVPFTGKKYEAGVQRHGVIEFPFRAILRKSASGDLQLGITPTHLTENNVEGKIQLVTFHRRPYTIIVNDEFWPVSHKEGGQIKIVHALEEPFKREVIFGEEEMGIKILTSELTEFRPEREESSAWLRFFMKFTTPSAWFQMMVGSPTLRLSERRITWDVSASKTKTLWLMVAGNTRHIESKEPTEMAQIDSIEEDQDDESTSQESSNQVGVDKNSSEEDDEEQNGSAESPKYKYKNVQKQQQQLQKSQKRSHKKKQQHKRKLHQAQQQILKANNNQEMNEDIEGQFQWPMNTQAQEHSQQYSVQGRKMMFVVALIGKAVPIQSPIKSRGIQKHLERDNLPSTVQFLFMAENRGDEKVVYRFALGQATREAAQLIPQESQGIMNVRDAILNVQLSNTQVPLCFQYNGEYKRPIWANRDDLLVLRQRLLKEDLKVIVNGKFAFGKTCSSSESTVEFRGTMERDQEMTEYARSISDEAKECNEDEKKGFYVSNVCIKNAEEQAAVLNLIDLEFKSTNLPPVFLNVTFQLEHLLKSYFWRDLSFNPVPTELQKHQMTAQPNSFRLLARSTPDQHYITVKLFKPKEILFFENIRTNRFTRNVVLPFTSTQGISDNIHERIYGLSQSEVSCSVENKFVSTFDNVTFEFDPEITTDCLHVLAQVNGPTELSVLAQNLGDKVVRTVVLLPANTRIDLLPPKDAESTSFRSSEELKDQNTETDRVLVNGKKVNSLPLILRDAEQKFLARLQVGQDKSLQIFSPYVKVTTNGKHIVIYGSQIMRNSTVGICGDFNGEKKVEFRSPRDCPLSSGSLLMASYALQSWDSKDLGQCKVNPEIKKEIEKEERDCKSQEFFLPELYSDGTCQEKIIAGVGDVVYNAVRTALKPIPGVNGKKWAEKARNKVRELLSGHITASDIAEIVSSGISKFIPYVGFAIKPVLKKGIQFVVDQVCKSTGCCSTSYYF